MITKLIPRVTRPYEDSLASTRVLASGTAIQSERFSINSSIYWRDKVIFWRFIVISDRRWQFAISHHVIPVCVCAHMRPDTAPLTCAGPH